MTQPESRPETRAESTVRRHPPARRAAAPAPRHRATHRRPRLRSWGALLKRHVVIAAVAATATGATVGTGVLVSGEDRQDPVAALMADAAAGAALDQETRDDLQSREQGLSRSDRRTSVDPAKQRLLAQETRSGGQLTRSKDLASGDPREIARAMLGQFGFSADQFGCLDALWTKESGWNVYADNPTSSAYGIPQALPGSKMASAGPDWAANPATQIRWGLGYIAGRYGSPCSAWAHSQANNWY